MRDVESRRDRAMAEAEAERGNTIDALLHEQRTYPPSKEFAIQANARADIYDRDPDEFWETEARERITWRKPFDALKEWDLPFAKWFLGGRLNVCENCVDRHVE